FEEGSDCHTGGIDARAVLYLGKQSGALNLSLTLRSRETVPAAFALAKLRVAHVDDDGPVTGRPFAKMPPHFGCSSLSVDLGHSPHFDCSSLSVDIGRSNTWAVCSGVSKSSSPNLGTEGGICLATSATTPITFSMPSLIAS